MFFQNVLFVSRSYLEEQGPQVSHNHRMIKLRGGHLGQIVPISPLYRNVLGNHLCSTNTFSQANATHSSRSKSKPPFSSKPPRGVAVSYPSNPAVWTVSLPRILTLYCLFTQEANVPHEAQRVPFPCSQSICHRVLQKWLQICSHFPVSTLSGRPFPGVRTYP